MPATMTITVDGLPVVITRKSVKNTTIRICDPGCQIKVTAPYFVTKRSIESMIRQKRPWIDEQINRIQHSPSSKAATATKEEQKAWMEVVKACTPVLVEQWEPIIGVKAEKLAYRNMKSRWGSCQPSTGRICINTRLALYPPECLEYVVVHELCHLREANHGPRFHKLMDTYMPDWKQRKAKLR